MSWLRCVLLFWLERARLADDVSYAPDYDYRAAKVEHKIKAREKEPPPEDAADKNFVRKQEQHEYLKTVKGNGLTLSLSQLRKAPLPDADKKLAALSAKLADCIRNVIFCHSFASGSYFHGSINNGLYFSCADFLKSKKLTNEKKIHAFFTKL
jgi:hypothetical protein